MIQLSVPVLFTERPCQGLRPGTWLEHQTYGMRKPKRAAKTSKSRSSQVRNESVRTRVQELEDFIWRIREAGDSIGARVTVVASTGA